MSSLLKIVMVAGGTASGKTTIAAETVKLLPRLAVVIQQDAYYRDRSHLSAAERRKLNFDEPAAFEWGLLLDHLRSLRAGRAIRMPQYSYRLHTRLKRTVRVEPAPVVIVEGLFPWWEPRLRRMADLKAFVAAGADVRFIRRLRRDLRERSRSAESVVEQYLGTVKPMHDRYVERCRRWAGLVLCGEDGGKSARALARAIRGL